MRFNTTYFAGFLKVALLASAFAQFGICHAALSHTNLESAKLQKNATFQTGKLHSLKMSYQLDALALADKKIQLLQSVFSRAQLSDYDKTHSYYNLSTLSIIKWPILYGENPTFKHGLSENATGVKLDVPFLEQMLDNAALELTAKKHFSGQKLESAAESHFSIVDFIKEALLFLGIIYILLFPIIGSVFGGMKYVQNRRNGLN